MKTALVISSFVASSHVGANASAFCLRRLGIQTHVLPTTLLGRHPGWGAPGGAPVPTATLESMWEAIQAQNLCYDGIMTGYMASPQQAELAGQIIRDIRRTDKDVLVLVDPVMGDNGRLYVSEAVASAITTHLLPLADIITPNLWELGYLSGDAVDTFDGILSAIKHLPSDALVTSVPEGAQIGALLHDKHGTVSVHHEKFSKVPHGGGDTLAGTFLAHRLNGKSSEDALAYAVAAIFEILSEAAAKDMGELPLIRYQDALVTAQPLPLERLTLD